MPITINGNNVNVVIFNNTQVDAVTINGNQVFPDGPDVSYFGFVMSSSGKTLTLHLDPGDGVTVNWGDGSAEEVVTGNSATHAYASGGNYTVSVSSGIGNAWSVGYANTAFSGNGDARIRTAELAGIVNISDRGFFESSLTVLTIGSGTTVIGNEALSGCIDMISLTSNAVNPPTVGVNAFMDVEYNIPIYVPAASVAAYQAASGWSDRSAYIQAIPT